MTNWQARLQALTNQTGVILQSLQDTQQVKALIEQLQMEPMLQALDTLPFNKLERRVADHRKRHGSLPLDEQAHRLIMDRTVELAQSGLVGSLVPFIGNFFPLSAEQTSQRQVQLAAELAILYGRSVDQAELRQEVLAILASVITARVLMQAGAGVLGKIPVAGAVVSASSSAAMTYAIGQATMQYHRALTAGRDGSTAVSEASDQARSFLVEADCQEQRMDSILLHLALADIPCKDRDALLERLKPLANDPEGLERLISTAEALPPLDALLDGLDEEFGAVLLTQAEHVVSADGRVSNREAALLRQISSGLREHASVDAGNFGNRILTSDFKATVRGLIFSSEGDWLLAVSDDGQLQGWRSYDGGIQYHQLYTVKAHEKEIRCFCLGEVCANGEIVERLYSSGEDRTIATWDFRSGQLLNRFDSSYSTGVQALCSCSDSILASGSWQGEITLWNACTGAAQRSLAGHDASVWALLGHPDGQRLISGGNDHKVNIWSLKQGDCLKQLCHPEGVYCLALAPDGVTLATGCWDRKIRLWSLETGELQQTIEGHTASIWQVAFDSTGRYIYSSSDDMQVRIWDLNSGSLRLCLEGHQNGVYALALSPVQPLLASGSWDRSVRLWSLDLS